MLGLLHIRHIPNHPNYSDNPNYPDSTNPDMPITNVYTTLK